MIYAIILIMSMPNWVPCTDVNSCQPGYQILCDDEDGGMCCLFEEVEQEPLGCWYPEVMVEVR